jgi:hypothetical protein
MGRMRKMSKIDDIDNCQYVYTIEDVTAYISANLDKKFSIHNIQTEHSLFPVFRIDCEEDGKEKSKS